MPRSNFCEGCHREYLEKVLLKKNRNCGRCSLEIFTPIGSHVTCVNQNEKKKSNGPKF